VIFYQSWMDQSHCRSEAPAALATSMQVMGVLMLCGFAIRPIAAFLSLIVLAYYRCMTSRVPEPLPMASCRRVAFSLHWGEYFQLYVLDGAGVLAVVAAVSSGKAPLSMMIGYSVTSLGFAAFNLYLLVTIVHGLSHATGWGVLIDVNARLQVPVTIAAAEQNHIYEGHQVEGERHGKGILKRRNGSTLYEGDWLSGKFHGQGRLLGIDGTVRYDGGWRNDVFDGYGRLYSMRGQPMFDGQWIMGRAQETTLQVRTLCELELQAIRAERLLPSAQLLGTQVADTIDLRKLVEDAPSQGITLEAIGMAIAELLTPNTVTTLLHVDGRQALEIKKLKGVHPVESMSFAGLDLGTTSAVVISSLVSTNDSLTSLDLSNNSIGEVGFHAIGKALLNSTMSKLGHIKCDAFHLPAGFASLNLSHQGITTSSATLLAGLLKSNSSLTSLDLSYNILFATSGPAFARALAPGIAANGSLTSLGLDGNHLGREGANALAPAIAVNGSLKLIGEGGLDLRNNSIGGVGWCAIIAAVCGSTVSQISSIDASGNSIGPTGAKKIAEALRSCVNGSLAILNLNGNELGPEGAKALAPTIAATGSLTSLHLRDNGFGSAGAEALAPALAANVSLTSLDLSDNYLHSAGAKALAPAIAANGSLMQLEVLSNNMGSMGEATIRKVVEGRAGFVLAM